MNCAKQMRTRTTQGFVAWRVMRLLRISGLRSPLTVAAAASRRVVLEDDLGRTRRGGRRRGGPVPRPDPPRRSLSSRAVLRAALPRRAAPSPAPPSAAARLFVFTSLREGRERAARVLRLAGGEGRLNRLHLVRKARARADPVACASSVARCDAMVTWIRKVPLDAFVLASVAVQLTVVVPIGKFEPEAGRQVTMGFGSSLSGAVTTYVTAAPAGDIDDADTGARPANGARATLLVRAHVRLQGADTSPSRGRGWRPSAAGAEQRTDPARRVGAAGPESERPGPARPAAGTRGETTASDVLETLGIRAGSCASREPRSSSVGHLGAGRSPAPSMPTVRRVNRAPLCEHLSTACVPHGRRGGVGVVGPENRRGPGSRAGGSPGPAAEVPAPSRIRRRCRVPPGMPAAGVAQNASSSG